MVLRIRDAGQGAILQAFLSNKCDPKKGAVSVWTYPKGSALKATHEVQVVYELAEFAKALETADAFVVYEGHSRYGQGPSFGPAGTPHVPDIKTFPINPWGVHFRMGYDATDTECVADLVHHSVTPAEYDLTTSGPKAFLPSALVRAASSAEAKQKAIKAKKIKATTVCSRKGAWRLFDTCDAKLAATTTTRGDKPLKGRHFYARLPRKPEDDFETAVQVGSANLDKSSLSCKLLFMASCSSHVHFFKPLDKRRKAVKSACKFLMTGQVCATSHAATFLEQVLVKGHVPMTRKGMKALLKALNGVKDSGTRGNLLRHVMAIKSQILAQVLRIPKSRDVTKSAIVRAVILREIANAADLVSSLERSDTIEAYNARRILCLFEADAVPYVLAELGTAGPNARKEGLEILWALLVSEEAWTVRESLAASKSDLHKLLEDTSPLPDEMPDHIERDFRGRICDLAFIVIQQLISPEYDQSLFRSMDENSRNGEIKRLKTRGIVQNIA